MSAVAGEHEHERRPFDWFSLLDILVWAALLVLVVLAAEWAWGAVVRQRISTEAGQYLAKAAVAETE